MQMKKHLFPIIILFLITLFFTFPLILHLNTYIPGFFTTDEPYGTIWNFWLLKHSWSSGVSSQFTSLIVYPFGRELFSGLLVPYPWLGLNYLLAITTGPLIAYNLQILANFFLSALFAYMLVFSLSQSRLAGILSGIIFSFSPQHFTRSWQHLSLTYFQWIPLILLSAILLYKDNRLRNTIFFAISLVLLFSFDFTITYLGLLGLFCLLFWIFLFHWKTKSLKSAKIGIYFKNIFFGFITLFLIFLPQILIILTKYKALSIKTASAYNPYHRPFEDLFAQSAKPLGYLLPASVHPIFGKFTEQFIGSPFYGISFTEHALYLGWTALALSFVAFKRWRKMPRNKGEFLQSGDSPYNREYFYIGFFIFLAIVAWLFSQPPWWKIGSAKIYMPSFFMYKVLPMFRAYCRFAILVILAVAVLAGFGFKFILEKFKAQTEKITVTALFCGLLLFEFWNYPPFKVIDLSKVPQVYYWLKEQPGNPVIAEYPMDIIGPNEMYKFYQTKHEKKIINGTIPGTYANKVAQTITKLSDPHTPGILKWMGVKYVLVHKKDYLNTELVEDVEELNKIPDNPGFKFIKSFPVQECPQKDIMCVQKTGSIDVYEIITHPKEPKVNDVK